MDYMDDDAMLADCANSIAMKREVSEWVADHDKYQFIFDEFEEPIDAFLDEFEAYK